VDQVDGISYGIQHHAGSTVNTGPLADTTGNAVGIAFDVILLFSFFGDKVLPFFKC
jgi:hypothetical protein